MDHKVSIIIPVYNNAKYLSKCLRSIQAQTCSNLEIIVIDDGSTDDSLKIAKTFSKSDSRFQTIHQANSGQSCARNTGIKKATGEYISFIDGDDEVAPTFIEKLLNAITSSKSTSLSVCGMHYKRLKSNSSQDVYLTPLRKCHPKESQKAYILYLLARDGRMYSSVNKLYKADIVKTLAFTPDINFAEDTKFVLDYLRKAKGEISFVLEPLYYYNFGTSTSTINKTAIDWQNWQKSYQNLKNWLGPHPSLRESFLLHLVHLRWRISFLRSKRRAKC